MTPSFSAHPSRVAADVTGAMRLDLRAHFVDEIYYGIIYYIKSELSDRTYRKGILC